MKIRSIIAMAVVLAVTVGLARMASADNKYAGYRHMVQATKGLTAVRGSRFVPTNKYAAERASSLSSGEPRFASLEREWFPKNFRNSY